MLPVDFYKGDTMKNKLKSIILIILVLLLTACSIITVFAETTYKYDGYTYSISTNTGIVLYDWDTSIDETLVLPDVLANRHFIDIANWAFEDRSDLKGLDLSNAVHLQRIGYESFINCSEIATDLVIPVSVVNILDRAFSGCSKISSITINGHVEMIPVECFYNCDSAQSLTLPDTVQVIGSWAFGSCDSLEYAEIPKSVTNIAPSAFKNDPNLTLGVWYGTVGYDYAKSQNIPYVLLDGVKLGDANGDGSVNINDVTQIQRHLAQLEQIEGIYLYAADSNQSGDLDISDATTVQQFVAQYQLPYPIGEVITQ